MSKRRNIKNYIRAALIMGLFAALVVYLPTARKAGTPFSDSPYVINHASVKHEFFKDPSFELEELNGVRVEDRQTGKVVYYFEYVANKQDTLRRIAALPFRKDDRPSSITYMLMESMNSPLDGTSLSTEEREAASFFLEADGEEFTFYECFKSPVKHTLLLSKNSDRILHKVEVV